MDAVYEMKVLKDEISTGEEQELRRLWKEAFEEEDAYLDYYHRNHLRHNRVWTLWDGDRLISMLHANPRRLWVNGTLTDSCFIVGVATDPSYRRRGCMGRLMNAALRTLQKEGMDFVYLLPAKEEYYLPFGFQTVGTQHAWRRRVQKDELLRWRASREEQMLPGVPGLTGTLSLPEYRMLPQVRETLPQLRDTLPEQYRKSGPPERRDLLEGEQGGERLADFANDWLKRRATTFTWRDSAYYRLRAEECIAMDGGLYVLQENGDLAGVASMGMEGSYWLLYDVVGDAMLAELEGSDEWEPVPLPQKIMIKWLGENDRIGKMLPFIMEELT